MCYSGEVICSVWSGVHSGWRRKVRGGFEKKGSKQSMKPEEVHRHFHYSKAKTSYNIPSKYENMRMISNNKTTKIDLIPSRA